MNHHMFNRLFVGILMFAFVTPAFCVELGANGNFPGDINGDNQVNIADIGALGMAWISDDAQADIAPVEEVDGIVNLLDFYEIVKHWLTIYDVEDFENETFSDYPWEMDAENPWTITSDHKNHGQFCARTGEIENNETTSLKITLTVEEGELRFFARISCEPALDFMYLFIDGEQVQFNYGNILASYWTAIMEWHEVVIPVEAGTHTFEWIYVKDYEDGVFVGDDAAYLDFIQFPPLAVVPASK